jgi:hypothetical protein
MKMKTIVLISCVKKKLPYRAKAKDLYVSTLFRLSFRFAPTLNPDAIYILSAKYGLVDTEQEIDTYDITLNKMPAKEVRHWADRTLKQLYEVVNLDKDFFILLAAEKYRKYLIPYLSTYDIPLRGLRIGEQLSWLKKTLDK